MKYECAAVYEGSFGNEKDQYVFFLEAGEDEVLRIEPRNQHEDSLTAILLGTSRNIWISKIRITSYGSMDVEFDYLDEKYEKVVKKLVPVIKRALVMPLTISRCKRGKRGRKLEKYIILPESGYFRIKGRIKTDTGWEPLPLKDNKIRYSEELSKEAVFDLLESMEDQSTVLCVNKGYATA